MNSRCLAPAERQQGNCKYGDNCRFSHGDPNPPRRNGASGGTDDRGPARSNNAFGGGGGFGGGKGFGGRGGFDSSRRDSAGETGMDWSTSQGPAASFGPNGAPGSSAFGSGGGFGGGGGAASFGRGAGSSGGGAPFQANPGAPVTGGFLSSSTSFGNPGAAAPGGFLSSTSSSFGGASGAARSEAKGSPAFGIRSVGASMGGFGAGPQVTALQAQGAPIAQAPSNSGADPRVSGAPRAGPATEVSMPGGWSTGAQQGQATPGPGPALVPSTG